MRTQRVSEFDEIGTTFGLSAGGQRCFLCNELLVDPAVYWHGSFRLYLHADCVPHLCAALLRDMREIVTDAHASTAEFLEQRVWPVLLATLTKERTS